MRAGDKLGGRFLIERRIGAGGMGIVYAAKDATTNLTVAVKVLLTRDPDSVARFEREAQMLERVRHPNVVAYIAHGMSDAREPFLAMDWLEGETLKDKFAARALSYPDVIDVGLGIARALADVHALGIVHRDLKPANVFLVSGRTGEVRVLDFGIARYRAGSRPLTAEGDILGTPQYMSPEQAMGSAAVDERTDLFALGAVLFRCVTGNTPFSGPALDVLLALVQSSAPSVLSVAPSTPARMARLIDSLLQRDPQWRPASAHAVFAELTLIYAEAGGRGTPLPTRALTSLGFPPRPTPTPSHTETGPPLPPHEPPRGAVPAPAPARRLSPNVVAGSIAGTAVVAVGIVAVIAYSLGSAASRKQEDSDPVHRSTVSPSSSAHSSDDAARTEGMPAPCLNPATKCSKLGHARLAPDDFLTQARAFARQQDANAEIGGGSMFIEPDGMVDTEKDTEALVASPSWSVSTSAGWFVAVPVMARVAPLVMLCRVGDLYRSAVAMGVDMSRGAIVSLTAGEIIISPRTTNPAVRIVGFDPKTCAKI